MSKKIFHAFKKFDSLEFMFVFHLSCRVCLSIPGYLEAINRGARLMSLFSFYFEELPESDCRS